jgi:hypothetical protein
MIVQNESENISDYNNLQYVEFLEFICRTSIVLFETRNGLSKRVHEFVTILHRHNFSAERLSTINIKENLSKFRDIEMYDEYQSDSSSSEED